MEPRRPYIQIRRGEYRDQRGFKIVGRDCWNRSIRIFTETRDSAERIRAKLKADQDITVEDFR